MSGNSGKKVIKGVVGLLAGLLLASCSDQMSVENTLLAPSGTKLEGPTYFASDEYLKRGKMHFRNRDYGIAEKNFRKAVEVTPGDIEAWLGLAASYDHLRRFDLADKAYKRVLRSGGKHPEVLNNIAYSYLLRGDTARARKFLLRAYDLRPNNQIIINNLAMLGESGRTVKRPVN